MKKPARGASSAAGAPHLKTQKTGDHTDQFGRIRKDEELSGGLLDLVGLDGEEDGGDVSVAASCDDYDINPEGGIGFSAAYQRSRGRTVVASTEKADAPAGDDLAETAKSEVDVNAARPTTFSRRGRGRRLADM